MSGENNDQHNYQQNQDAGYVNQQYDQNYDYNN